MKHYVDVVFTANIGGNTYTYEVPERFVRDVEIGKNLVVVEARGVLALALVVKPFVDELHTDKIKPILDVCSRVKATTKVYDRLAKIQASTKRCSLF